MRLFMGGQADKLYTTETIESTDGWGVQHRKVFSDFSRHIVDGTPLLAPGSEGINGVNLANAMLLSSWLGHEVDNPVDENLFLAELNKRIAAEGKYPPIKED
jgi:UDP-N-acetyl-2-amino-2-deoxyglucuronate dehydrogenase